MTGKVRRCSVTHTLESMDNLIDLYKTWDKPKKAKERRTKLLQKKAVEE